MGIGPACELSSSAETWGNLLALPLAPVAGKTGARGRGYRHQRAYALLVMEDDRPADFRVVKTAETLSKIETAERLLGRSLLIHPNPVKLRKGFWRAFRRARSPEERLACARKYGVLTDEKILAIERAIIDVDSPFEVAVAAWCDVCREMGFDGPIGILERSRSGNLHIIIEIAPGRGGRRLRPHTRSRNGRTHLENLREALYILVEALRQRGVKADPATVHRINHPVWLRPSAVFTEGGTREVRLYDLYRKAKKLERTLKYPLFSRTPSSKASPKRNLPAGPAKTVPKRPESGADAANEWKRRVVKLCEKHRSRRFIHVMLPAVGWAKWLGLEREFVFGVLRELLPDKRNLEKDLQTAWRYARPLEFKLAGRAPDPQEAARKLLEALRARDGEIPRQEAIRLLGGLAWLTDRAAEVLEESGLIEVEFRKVTPGPGRRAKIFRLRPGDDNEKKDSLIIPEGQARCGCEWEHECPSRSSDWRWLDITRATLPNHESSGAGGQVEAAEDTGSQSDETRRTALHTHLPAAMSSHAEAPQAEGELEVTEGACKGEPDTRRAVANSMSPVPSSVPEGDELDGMAEACRGKLKTRKAMVNSMSPAATFPQGAGGAYGGESAYEEKAEARKAAPDALCPGHTPGDGQRGTGADVHDGESAASGEEPVFRQRVAGSVRGGQIPKGRLLALRRQLRERPGDAEDAEPEGYAESGEARRVLDELRERLRLAAARPARKLPPVGTAVARALRRRRRLEKLLFPKKGP